MYLLEVYVTNLAYMAYTYHTIHTIIMMIVELNHHYDISNLFFRLLVLKPYCPIFVGEILK